MDELWMSLYLPLTRRQVADCRHVKGIDENVLALPNSIVPITGVLQRRVLAHFHGLLRNQGLGDE